MPVCEKCNLENPPQRHFCEDCGWYLPWDPTAELPVATRAESPGPRARTRQQQPIRVGEVRRAAEAGRQGRWPEGRGRVAPPPEVAPAEVTLAIPGQDLGGAEQVVLNVAAGAHVTLRATIRNRSQIVECFVVRVPDLPRDWWTATPSTVHLVPFGTAGQCEQEVEIRIHPPRTPDARAGQRPFHVAAECDTRPRATGQSAPGSLHIEAYTDQRGTLRPERSCGRRRGRFTVTVRNRGNDTADYRLSASDAEEECVVRFDPPRLELEPGATGASRLTVRPPKQFIIGRPVDRPLTIQWAPGADGVAPTLHAVFRQRPWLPWWIPILVPLLIAVAIALWAFAPFHTVPALTGTQKGFDAQRLLQKSSLRLDPRERVRVTNAVAPGTVLDQVPPEGKHVRRGTLVSVLVAVAPTRHRVPDVVGLTLPEADRKLGEHFKLGASQPQSAGPSAPITSQWPAAHEVRHDGTPVNVSLAVETPAVPGHVPPPARTPAPDEPSQNGPPAGPPLAFDDGHDLFVALDGAKPAKASTDGTATEPAWDASGHELAYMRYRAGRGRIWGFDPADGRYPGRPLSDVRGDYHRPAFAPDGSALAFVDKRDGRGDLCVVPATGAADRTRCHHDPNWSFERLAWSPDSQRILLVAYARSGKAAGIVEYRSDGAPAALASWRAATGRRGLALAIEQPLHVAWAPTADTVSVTAGEEGAPARVYTVSAAGDELAQTGELLDGITACEVAWHPDGRLGVSQGACVDGGTREIILIDRDDNQRVSLGPGANPAWPPVPTKSAGEGTQP